MLKKITLVILSAAAFSFSANAQNEVSNDSVTAENFAGKVETTKIDNSKDSVEAAKKSKLKYRRLQSNGLLVETAYHQDKDEMQHSFSIVRNRENYWSSEFKSEVPLFSSRHQLTVSVPTQFFSRDTGPRGAGDTAFEYSYTLIGSNSSRVTVSPTAGISIPTGNYRKELGSGATGVKFSVPVSYMLGQRFGATTNPGISYFRNARNDEDERASLVNYELGQTFVWYAKTNLNFLVEGVWESPQKIIGDNLRKREHEFYVSPGARVAHTFRNGMTLIPGIAVPIGVGNSRGNNGVFLYLAFEHRFRKSED